MLLLLGHHRTLFLRPSGALRGLIEQHRVHRFVVHGVRLALIVASHEGRVHLLHLPEPRGQNCRRHPGQVLVGGGTLGFEREDRFACLVHRFNCMLESFRGDDCAEVTIRIDDHAYTIGDDGTADSSNVGGRLESFRLYAHRIGIAQITLITNVNVIVPSLSSVPAPFLRLCWRIQFGNFVCGVIDSRVEIDPSCCQQAPEEPMAVLEKRRCCSRGHCHRICLRRLPALLTNSSRFRRKRKAGEREQRERGIRNIHYCFHGFISFHLGARRANLIDGIAPGVRYPDARPVKADTCRLSSTWIVRRYAPFLAERMLTLLSRCWQPRYSGHRRRCPAGNSPTDTVPSIPHCKRGRRSRYRRG